MKNVLETLGKSVLIPLGLRAPTSAIDAAIQKKLLAPGVTTFDFMKIAKSLKGCDLLIKGVSETIKNEEK